ncbi:putative epoxide hydrolase, partial [Teratosphaeria destructans]
PAAIKERWLTAINDEIPVVKVVQLTSHARQLPGEQQELDIVSSNIAGDIGSRASRSPAGTGVGAVHSYRMHVSQKYLDLTKRKLELARLPREPQTALSNLNLGITKSDLEPLIDHWLEDYDWRREEASFNENLPQFRAVINGTRLHFVHRRSNAPNAIPLLFVHGFPESFVTIGSVIEMLCAPVSTPPGGDENVPAFHVVCPSIPGFGFSDPLQEEGNAIPTTAAIFDALMKSLGYGRYMVHGSGWGFKICRVLAIAHSDSCMAIHTVNPDVPPPRFDRSTPKSPIDKMCMLTSEILRRPSFGYGQENILSGSGMSSPALPSPGARSPVLPGVFPQPTERPQTISYALCDSPSGLLAYVLDLIQPQACSRPSTSPSSLAPSTIGTPSERHSPVLSRSPSSPAGSVSSSQTSQSQSRSSQTPLELGDHQSPWTPTAIINWTMIYWLPGPEVALRWLANSAALVPSLWLGHSNVPLGITHFRDSNARSPSPGTGQTPPQWAEAYHRIAMVRQRVGRVRFPAWERPMEIVMDIRELAGILGAGPLNRLGPDDMHMAPPPLPDFFAGTAQ